MKKSGRCKTCGRLLGIPAICFYCNERQKPQSVKYREDSVQQLMAKKVE
jgi:hypothetical protein